MRGVALGARLNAVATVAKLLPLLLIARRRAVRGADRAPHRDSLARRPPTSPARRCCSCSPSPASSRRSCRAARCATPRAPSPAPSRWRCSASPRSTSRSRSRRRASSAPALGGASTPLADAAGAAFGGWARALLLAGAAISMFGYLGGMTLAVPRLVFALARDGVPAARARHRAPDPSDAAGGHRRPDGARARARDLGHVRAPRHPGERVGAGALPRMRGGGVAPAIDGTGRRRRCAAAAGRRRAVPGRAGHPVAAHGADAERVDRLRRRASPWRHSST